jgi:hypothetical protein
MERGIITAVGPMLVLMMSRDRGIKRIMSIIKGMDRKRLTIRDNTLYRTRRGISPPGEVLKSKAPRGNPRIQAKIVAMKVI